MKTAFSGVQPSGAIHIGNYLGAIKNWLEIQNQYQCFFCIVDLHAITIKQDPQILRQKIKEVAAIYLAAGLNPEKSIIFIQSQVPAHTELCWILNCLAKIPELERMTQFKEKSGKHRREVNLGLFDYPVLMAADILLYQTEIVPVGADQKQHVELARDLAERFNNLFGQTFTIPEPIIQKEEKGSRIMGLDNPLNKMSKSAINSCNYIALLDPPELIKDKIKKAVTDSGQEIKYGPEKPAISNLLTIYSLFSGKSIKELEKEYKDGGYVKFKNDLAETIINFLQPFQNKYQKIINDQKYLQEVLEYGKNKAQKIAEQTLKEVKEKMGLVV